MTQLGRIFCTLAAISGVALLAAVSVTAGGAQRTEDRKPDLSLRASPPVGFSPLRVRIVVELRGGADDYADFYCPTIEWDWADGTVSESAEDCVPYEAGKSTIRRRFTAEHVFRNAGVYRVYFRLKQRDRTVAAANANIQVRSGVREDFEN